MLIKISRSRKLFYGILAIGALLLAISAHHFATLYDQLAYFVSLIEAPYQQWLEQQNTSNPTVLIPLAFVGGLIASISPCVLSLLPVNLSYIGTLELPLGAMQRSKLDCSRSVS